MRKFLERYHIPIGLFLSFVVLAGVITLWIKDFENRKTFQLSDDQKQIDQLKAENDQLKALLSQAQEAQSANATNGQIELENKVNINKADNKSLEDLPAIGPVYAQRIIDYRNQNGNFSKIEDVKNVKGIGEKVFEKIKDLIDVN